MRTIGRPVIREGKVVLVRGCFQDISEMKAARDEVARIAKFPSENPNPVLSVDASGIVLYANPATQRLLPVWRCGVGEPLTDALYPAVKGALT